MSIYSRFRPSLGKYDRQNRDTRGRDSNEIPDDGEDFVWDVHVPPGPRPEPEDAATHRVVLQESRETDAGDRRTGRRIFSWVEVALTQEEIAERADSAGRAAKLAGVGRRVAWLRARSDAAEEVTVTAGNAVAVLQSVVDDLAVFFDGFADLLEGQGVDK